MMTGNARIDQIKLNRPHIIKLKMQTLIFGKNGLPVAGSGNAIIIAFKFLKSAEVFAGDASFEIDCDPYFWVTKSKWPLPMKTLERLTGEYVYIIGFDIKNLSREFITKIFKLMKPS